MSEVTITISAIAKSSSFPYRRPRLIPARLTTALHSLRSLLGVMVHSC
ncbi:hypothetical protein H6G97_48295 [Nostoc flagelliforme FACHB-838]|uniref:Uncharacterized protein n=1 Tax=Nostoc flagelliforme FACHB-838 TaxID=2692904 RepID=A0ABR8E4H8_9NOSO|nr:hypothetical protein [Nostoc flagelliforme FACHB-838]